MLIPLLFGGVFIVGFLGALVPEKQIATWVGDNSFTSNLISSVVGCLMYFATLTEVPILEALMKNGMASGPALGVAARRPGTVAAQHPGDPLGLGQYQDRGVRRAGGRHVHLRRHGLRRLLSDNPVPHRDRPRRSDR